MGYGEYTLCFPISHSRRGKRWTLTNSNREKICSSRESINQGVVIPNVTMHATWVESSPTKGREKPSQERPAPSVRTKNVTLRVLEYRGGEAVGPPRLSLSKSGAGRTNLVVRVQKSSSPRLLTSWWVGGLTRQFFFFCLQFVLLHNLQKIYYQRGR